MATRAARNQKAYRERRKALIQKRIALVLEVLDGIANGSNGIILTLDKDLWSINFHWGGEQSAYDVVEVRANALGLTLGELMAEIEQRTLQQYQQQVNAKHEAQGLKTALRFSLSTLSAEIEQRARDEGMMGGGVE